MVTRSPLLLETLYVQEQGTHLGLNAGRIEVRLTWGLLLLGEHLHVGKNTTCGLGKYRIIVQ